MIMSKTGKQVKLITLALIVLGFVLYALTYRFAELASALTTYSIISFSIALGIAIVCGLMSFNKE
jgi:hypothetical protein